MAKKVLKNGTVLSFDDASQSIKVLRNASILIVEDEITAIGDNVEIPAGAEVIDVTGKIVTPGFINTHSHVWQSAHRTLAPNTTLAEYMFCYGHWSGITKSYSSEDIYMSSLEGYLEGLNGGTTAFVDHAHNNWDLQAMKRGWDAAVDGGARVWWCPNLEDRPECKMEQQVEFMKTLGERTKENHPLTAMGVAWDGFMMSPAEGVDAMKQTIKQLRPEAITLHFLGKPWPIGEGLPVLASKSGFQDLKVPVVFSHGGLLNESDRATVREHDWNISITPESEYHYGHGNKTSQLIQDQGSLGIDTNWTFSGDILTQTRLWLQSVRNTIYNNTLDKGVIPRQNPMSVEDAFLMATRQGGRAVRRDDVGVLKVGAKADIVVFDGDSPNMVGWTDPIAAVVLHANVGDVEHVLVGGEFRKRDRKLLLKNGDWPTFSKKFAELARRVYRENSTVPPNVLGDKFWGMADYGDVEVVSTRRQT